MLAESFREIVGFACVDCRIALVDYIHSLVRSLLGLKGC